MAQAKTLTDSEFKRVIAVAKNGRHAERNEIILQLSFYAGLRACEIASLRYSDVFTPDGEVKHFIRLHSTQTKGRTGRTITISKKLATKLTELGRYHANKNYYERALIASQKGGHFSANSLTQVFLKLYDKAGIDGASGHSGRRSFCTRLAAKGTGARVLQKLMGHRSLQTTQAYIDCTEEMLTNAVNLL